MRVVRIAIGRPAVPEALGGVLVPDLSVDGEHWRKGRRLTADDLARLAAPGATVDLGARGATDDPVAPGGRRRSPEGGEDPAAAAGGPSIVVLVLGPDEVHEDEAASALAAAVAGPGLVPRGPAESRVDLLAAMDGVLHVRIAALERLDAIDPLQVFTLYDGQVVRAGEVVASVKIGPHAVRREVLDRGLRVARPGMPLVRVAGFVPRRVAVVVREAVRPIARERFERGIEARVGSLGSELAGIAYAPDAGAVEGELRRVTRGPGRADVVLTAGAASTDPSDPFFRAIDRLGGRVVRHGVPAHPGSMVWLARVGTTDLLGLPSCGAYSKATAADLLLPRLLTGERASARMAASLGHGGELVRAMRFRFPAYARDLEAPEG